MAKKIGVIRCDFHSLQCNGGNCFVALKDRKEAFAVHDDELLLVGYATCGGCCGRDAVRRAKQMVDSGAAAIHLSNCVWVDEKCPFKERIKSDIEGLGVPVIKGTHATYD